MTNLQEVSRKQFAVIYRTGGTANYRWNRILENYATREAAVLKASELNRMGYPTHIHNAFFLDAAGLPETFE